MPRPGNSLSWLLPAAVALWLGLVVAAPVGRALEWPLAPLLYAFFDPLCHQIPARSFHLLGQPLAVCHRCFGLYLGFGAGLLLLPILAPLRRALLQRPRLLLLFLLPMAFDVVSPNTPWSRFGTGFLAAFPAALFAALAVEQLAARSWRELARPWSRS